MLSLMKISASRSSFVRDLVPTKSVGILKMTDELAYNANSCHFANTTFFTLLNVLPGWATVVDSSL